MTRSYGGRTFPRTRMRRLRRTEALRRLCAETSLSAADLIWPLFVIEGHNASQPVAAMPGVSRVSVDLLPALAEQAAVLGIPALALFPAIEEGGKSLDGREAWRDDNLVARALQALRGCGLATVCDVALDPYTSHGQDGLLNDAGEIDNDSSVRALEKQALSLAAAGADILAPSDMMDGRIGCLRARLDREGFAHLPLMSYAAKYASCFYNPFREALGSRKSLKKADKRAYQMDSANSEEAMWEIAMDLQEGADLVIVKPGLPYLDIAYRAREAFGVPVVCYHVSGEYSALRAAAERGWIDERKAVLESLQAFKRAGACAILSYFALEAARWLQEPSD